MLQNHKYFFTNSLFIVKRKLKKLKNKNVVSILSILKFVEEKLHIETEKVLLIFFTRTFYLHLTFIACL